MRILRALQCSCRRNLLVPQQMCSALVDLEEWTVLARRISHASKTSGQKNQRSRWKMLVRMPLARFDDF